MKSLSAKFYLFMLVFHSLSRHVGSASATAGDRWMFVGGSAAPNLLHPDSVRLPVQF
jgi:hypothetical protein